MMVGVVTKAPDGATLNSSYETRYACDTDKDNFIALNKWTRTILSWTQEEKFTIFKWMVDQWYHSHHKVVSTVDPWPLWLVGRTLNSLDHGLSPSWHLVSLFAPCSNLLQMCKLSPGLKWWSVNERWHMIKKCCNIGKKSRRTIVVPSNMNTFFNKGHGCHHNVCFVGQELL